MTTIHRATHDDIPLIRSLAEEAFRETYRALLAAEQLDYMMKMMYSPKTLHHEIETGVAWFVAKQDGEACGYLSIEEEGEGLFHLQKIYLLSAFQGRGAGRELFNLAVAYIQEVHPSPCRMELNVNRSNPAIAFYQRMGMERVREGDFHIGNGYYMNDYIMALEIE